MKEQLNPLEPLKVSTKVTFKIGALTYEAVKPYVKRRLAKNYAAFLELTNRSF